MPSLVICLGDWIEGSTTICNRRLLEFAFEWIPRHLEAFVIYRHFNTLQSGIGIRHNRDLRSAQVARTASRESAPVPQP